MELTIQNKQRQYTEEQQEFKNKWVKSAMDKLDNHTDDLKQQMEDIFDSTFSDNIIELYNSVYNETYQTLCKLLWRAYLGF